MNVRIAGRIGLVGLLVIAGAAPLQAQRQTVESVGAIRRWVAAVNEHVPGHPDAAVKTITAMRYSDRRTLNTSYSMFIRLLRERDDAIVARDSLDNQVAVLARAVRQTPGVEKFLKRAAVLHSDALFFRSRFPAVPDDAPPAVPRRETSPSGLPSSIRPELLPPLLTNHRMTLTHDGEVLGDVPADWQLPFARSLLEELRRPTEALSIPDSAFIADWYHVVAAYLFAQGMNGDATAHLRDAARVLADDPRLLFDRATYAEAFGLPVYQVVHETTRAGVVLGGIPQEAKTNAEAERLYRRTLEIAPEFLEARVRLARLLEHRGQHEEAAAHIAQVVEARPSGVEGFYARIVAGRVSAARGRYEEALQHYYEAEALSPGAQSALLGASYAALMLADVPRTLAAIEPLGTTATNDPWIDYQLGAGRDVNDLAAALWARVSK